MNLVKRSRTTNIRVTSVFDLTEVGSTILIAKNFKVLAELIDDDWPYHAAANVIRAIPYCAVFLKWMLSGLR